MRLLLVLIAFGMIAVPALMMLASSDLTRNGRVMRALIIFLTPALALGLIHGVPELDGRAVTHASTWTALRLVLTGLALILPWCLYVLLRPARRP